TLVSIIVPAKNDARVLRRLLISLQRAHEKAEVIIADYASNDNTPLVARSFGARVIEVDRPGVGYASFIAVNQARGEIIIRTDADAVFPPHLIDYALNVFKRFKSVQIVNVGHIYLDSGIIDNLMAYLYDKYWRKPWNTTGHFIAFRRHVKDIVNFDPRLRYDEDWDFGQRAYERLGRKVFHYNHMMTVFVSARRIKTTGRMSYVLGRRVR
ncbi:MAG: glycosyltransferase, partial [Thermoproteota archaeon]